MLGSIAHLQPRCTQASAQRLQAEVEAAVVAGADLGDRRHVLNELTGELHRNFARVQSALAELKAFGDDRDPASESARIIRLGEEACAEVLGRLQPLLLKADHMNALLQVQPTR